jgi:hypothetical protein
MKISFCTAIKDRLFHLKKTLPQNLADAEGNAEFVILDYDSNDDLGSWIKPLVKGGYVTYCRAENQPYWRNSHAKNISTLCASGEVVCNLDADNYITKGFVDLIKNTNFNRTILTAPKDLEGVTGRIACKKKDFIYIGGYNEDYSFGWGCEDIDLIERACHLGYSIQYIDRKFLKEIKHDDSLRGQLCEIKDIRVSNTKSLAMMKDSIDGANYKSNLSRVWGYCEIKKNYKEHVEVGIKPIKI